MFIKQLEMINIRNRRNAEIKGELMISLIEAAQINKISRTRMFQLLAGNRVPGAYKIGKEWAIPSNWKYKRRGRKKPKPSFKKA